MDTTIIRVKFIVDTDKLKLRDNYFDEGGQLVNLGPPQTREIVGNHKKLSITKKSQCVKLEHCR